MERGDHKDRNGSKNQSFSSYTPSNHQRPSNQTPLPAGQSYKCTVQRRKCFFFKEKMELGVFLVEGKSMRSHGGLFFSSSLSEL